MAGLCGEGPGPTTAWLPLHTGPQRRLSEYGVGQTRDSSVCHRRDASQAGGGAAPRRHSASGLADSLRGLGPLQLSQRDWTRADQVAACSPEVNTTNG